ncbi:hypothetical protein J437_LFUL012562 [Ladona fulva]|uniref:Uncharacterized protein n=1 Tax=Ladona fulva TaxID=123851 RepID=A0A8K0KLF6_LADFU|nr:hypothetical protein J437_LFUL012562 [Ladona fulva]
MYFSTFSLNPDIVLVHYLNVPYPDDNKLVITPSLALWGDKKEWTKEELVSQLKPMCECATRHVPYRLAGSVVKGEGNLSESSVKKL